MASRQKAAPASGAGPSSGRASRRRGGEKPVAVLVLRLGDRAGGHGRGQIPRRRRCSGAAGRRRLRAEERGRARSRRCDHLFTSESTHLDRPRRPGAPHATTPRPPRRRRRRRSRPRLALRQLDHRSAGGIPAPACCAALAPQSASLLGQRAPARRRASAGLPAATPAACTRVSESIAGRRSPPPPRERRVREPAPWFRWSFRARPVPPHAPRLVAWETLCTADILRDAVGPERSRS